jgi:lamin tail-like protein/Ig-like domain-containing protein
MPRIKCQQIVAADVRRRILAPCECHPPPHVGGYEAVKKVTTHFARLILLALTVTVGGSTSTRAQLAISEVMSATRPVTNMSGEVIFRGPEYWELTNYGTNDIDLNGYSFRDSNSSAVWEPFANLVLRAGESIIFFRPNKFITTPAGFHAWWGEGKLRPDLRFYTWASPGLSGWDGDAVRLYDARNMLVDAVRFGRARRGRPFTYDGESGLFGVFSSLGVDGAVAAEWADDVGSPGTTVGPVPVHIIQAPADQIADAGASVTFSVLAGGFPRPRYQWFARGSELVGETSETLTLENVQSADGGTYEVVISNSLNQVVRAGASLTVNTNPAAPTIIIAPADAMVFPGQTAVFTVLARGFPAPTYQWEMDGVEISDATAPRLEIANVDETLNRAQYSVRIANALGSTNVSAHLIVTPRPDVRITEVMALPADEDDNRHFDWFELTNYDTNPVNLLGWRFSDDPSFAAAVTITNELTLQPGESAVFAERLNDRLFTAWWGAESLPANFKLVTYSGFGLGWSGDELFVWNGAATEPNDTVATLAWATSTAGVSFECERWCDPEGFGCLDLVTGPSVLGLRGAFRARDGGDIGSPGYVSNPALRFLSANMQGAGNINLLCRVIAGRSYRLHRTDSLASNDWTPLPTVTATNNVMTIIDAFPLPGTTWFYLLEELP